MSIRSTHSTRNLDSRKSSVPTIGKGKPLDARGNEGDLTFRRTSEGLKLYIKANHKWHGIKVGESFDSLEKKINEIKSKVDTIKQFRLPSTYSVTGDFTLDVSGNIVLDTDGARLYIKDNEESRFYFDCGNTALTIYDDQDTGDLFKIQVAQHGATTISTVDDDSNAAHLTFSPDGHIKFITGDGELDSVEYIIGSNTYAAFAAEDGSYSQLKMYENGGESSSDYFNISVAEHGETTLTTVDAASNAANLTMTIDGNITLDSAGEIVLDQTDRMKWNKAGTVYGQMDVNTTSNFTLYEQGGASTNDYFQIECGTDGDTTIKTIDAAGAGGHLRFAPDGSFLIKATSGAGADVSGWGQLWIKTGLPTDLYYTNDAGQDIQLTSGSSAAGSATFKHLINGGFNYSYTAGTKVYIPLNGYIIESSLSSSRNEYQVFVAPYDGSLTQVIFRSEEACGSTVVGLHKSSTGTEIPNATAAVSVTVDMATDDTPYKFAFTSSNVFSAGDVIAISFDPTNDANDTIFTAEFQLDSSSGL